METILGLKFNETTPECTKKGDKGICKGTVGEYYSFQLTKPVGYMVVFKGDLY